MKQIQLPNRLQWYSPLSIRCCNLNFIDFFIPQFSTLFWPQSTSDPTLAFCWHRNDKFQSSCSEGGLRHREHQQPFPSVQICGFTVSSRGGGEGIRRAHSWEWQLCLCLSSMYSTSFTLGYDTVGPPPSPPPSPPPTPRSSLSPCLFLLSFFSLIFFPLIF